MYSNNIIGLEDLKAYDLELVFDIESISEDGEDYKEVCYIRTYEDRSVGMFGYTISPYFYSIKDITEWWKTIKEVLQ